VRRVSWSCFWALVGPLDGRFLSFWAVVLWLVGGFLVRLVFVSALYLGYTQGQKK